MVDIVAHMCIQPTCSHVRARCMACEQNRVVYNYTIVVSATGLQNSLLYDYNFSCEMSQSLAMGYY